MTGGDRAGGGVEQETEAGSKGVGAWMYCAATSGILSGCKWSFWGLLLRCPE